MAAESGGPAHTFTYPGTDNTDEGRRDYPLSDYRGRAVVVVFYPGDSTPVCTRQLTSYTQDIDSFTEAGAQVLAISPQSVPSHEDFSCKQAGFAFPLLADTAKATAQAYAIRCPLGCYTPSAPVVSADRKVRSAHRA